MIFALKLGLILCYRIAVIYISYLLILHGNYWFAFFVLIASSISIEGKKGKD